MNAHLSLAVATCLVTCTLASGARAGVPKSRLERLKSGVNITRWFTAWGPVGPDHYRTYISDDELAMMHKMGIRHVRLCFSPEFLYDPGNPAEPIPNHLALYEEAIRRIEAHGMAVVVDPHNTVQPRIEQDGPWRDGFPTFWGALAAKLKRFDPEKTFFELVNEPVFDRQEDRWFALQEKLVAAIRRSAPEHTIICTGPNWGGIDGLLKLTPLADSNIVYSFHFYDPFPFTHQGATWAGRVPPLLKGLPYPSNPQAVADVLARTDDGEAKAWIRDYGEKRWNREKLSARLAQALEWGKKYNVPLYCGEFGVYPLNAPAASRRNWFRDFASALRASGIGYAAWGWDDVFSFGRRLVGGKPVIDTVPIEPLGLKEP
ncbi:MAG: glycoside hydrolase family 5 protein [Chthonomonadales bacterium]